MESSTEPMDIAILALSEFAIWSADVRAGNFLYMTVSHILSPPSLYTCATRAETFEYFRWTVEVTSNVQHCCLQIIHGNELNSTMYA